MSSDFFRKQPFEEFDIAVDFASLRLESGESITVTTVTAVKCSDDTDATSDIIDSDSEAAGVVTIAVKNGVSVDDNSEFAPQRYKITTRVTTDAGSQYEHDVIMEVRQR